MATRFPTELGTPLLRNYQVRPFEAFRRVAVTDGPPRYRLNSPRPSSIVQATWLWTPAQYFVFKVWYENFLEIGEWFLIRLANGLYDPSTALLTLQECEAHFYRDWQARIDPDSGNWEVSMELEVLYKTTSAGIEQNAVDAGNITDTRPTDAIDARNITEDRPDDAIDSLFPAYWQ